MTVILMLTLLDCFMRHLAFYSASDFEDNLLFRVHGSSYV